MSSSEIPKNTPIGKNELKDLKDSVRRIVREAPPLPWAPNAERRTFAFGKPEEENVFIVRSPETDDTIISVTAFKEKTPTGGQIFSSKELALFPDQAKYKKEETVYAANGERILPEEDQDTTTPLMEQFRRKQKKDQFEKELGVDQVTVEVYEDFKKILGKLDPKDLII